MSDIQCSNCKSPYPESGVPYRCTTCGGTYDYASLPIFNPNLLDNPSLMNGMWRHRHTFMLPEHAPQIYLGEGNTPLIWKDFNGVEIGFKLEYLNPTGSFKDRGTALLVSFLKSRDVESAVEDSSGNAGA